MLLLLVYVNVETQAKRRYYNNYYCACFSNQREKINLPIGSNDYFKLNIIHYYCYCSKKHENSSLTYQYLRLFQLLSRKIFTLKGLNVVLCVIKQKTISCIHFSFIVHVVT